MVIQFPAGRDLDAQIQNALQALENGDTTHLEHEQLDLKEEAGRRNSDGTVNEGVPESEVAAKKLAHEIACMSNSGKEGALLVGVADDHTLIGTELDAQWLRHRVYQLLDRRLTVDVEEVLVNNARLLILRIPPAIEAIRYQGKIYSRVSDNCVEVDAATWYAKHAQLHLDWSAQSSAQPPTNARAVALERAREYLRESGEQSAIDLASATDTDLLKRIGAIGADGNLTNGGALMFAARPEAALDYIQRDTPGGDSVIRLRPTNVSVIEELRDVDLAIRAANRIVHRAGNSIAVGQIESLPIRAVRETIVNGVAHRDWYTATPTTIEHVGATLTVTSPGGFPDGVTTSNIITHPSTPRNKALTALLAKLRIAEREGIGVDRMVGDMARYGYPAPVIEELSGPKVRVVLLGGQPDQEWLTLLSKIRPPETVNNLDSLLLLQSVITYGWIDANRGSEPIQKSPAEADHALNELARTTVDAIPVIVAVKGVPEESEPAWRPSREVRGLMPARTKKVTAPAKRASVARDWAQRRGRISSTELADIAGTYMNYAGEILKTLADEGVLEGAREERTGRGFHYLPTGKNP